MELTNDGVIGALDLNFTPTKKRLFLKSWHK